MVEGHSVHRVATLHRQRLVGKAFTAWSPNGRFQTGAECINGRVFSRIEAAGKNLFAFFVNDSAAIDDTLVGDDHTAKDTIGSDSVDLVVVVHIHFGMAGNWAVYDTSELDDDEGIPEPSSTTRLRLEGHGLVADLSAMTVQHGGLDLYHTKKRKLGEDPLRNDANPEELWTRVQQSNKSIGLLLMDQSFFAGPGNIYRCEILFKAGVHPDTLGKDLTKTAFDKIWYHTVTLLKRGYETGSILTVDPDEARALGRPQLRRYIYNTSKCPRCNSPIQTWLIQNRTCYACSRCQTAPNSTVNATCQSGSVTTLINKQQCVPFLSHCAAETADRRWEDGGPERLTVSELKQELAKRGITEYPTRTRKSELIRLLTQKLSSSSALPMTSTPPSMTQHSSSTSSRWVSPEEAAVEKAMAGESLAVEHIAELAPQQARKVRARVLQFDADRNVHPNRRHQRILRNHVISKECDDTASRHGSPARRRAIRKGDDKVATDCPAFEASFNFTKQKETR